MCLPRLTLFLLRKAVPQVRLVGQIANLPRKRQVSNLPQTFGQLPQQKLLCAYGRAPAIDPTYPWWETPAIGR